MEQNNQERRPTISGRHASVGNFNNTPFSTHLVPSRTRSESLTINGGRQHAASVGSVESGTLSDMIQEDSREKSRGKIKLMDERDLEKQLIITAGGKKEDVFKFILKLLFLTVIVLGSSVLIFYAL